VSDTQNEASETPKGTREGEKEASETRNEGRGRSTQTKEEPTRTSEARGRTADLAVERLGATHRNVDETVLVTAVPVLVREEPVAVALEPLRTSDGSIPVDGAPSRTGVPGARPGDVPRGKDGEAVFVSAPREVVCQQDRGTWLALLPPCRGSVAVALASRSTCEERVPLSFEPDRERDELVAIALASRSPWEERASLSLEPDRERDELVDVVFNRIRPCEPSKRT
jgi:hypothetical protein